MQQIKKTHKQKKISLSAVRWRRHRAVFRTQISIKATYNAYYFGWLYSNFNHNRKQSKPWSVPSENYILFMFLATVKKQFQNNILLKYANNSSFWCFVAYLFFWTSTSEYNQVPVRFLEIISNNYIKTHFNFLKCWETILKFLFWSFNEKITNSYTKHLNKSNIFGYKTKSTNANRQKTNEKLEFKRLLRSMILYKKNPFNNSSKNNRKRSKIEENETKLYHQLAEQDHTRTTESSNQPAEEQKRREWI